MLSVEIHNASNELVYSASGFATSTIALEDAATFLLQIIPIHVKIKVDREVDGLSIYKRSTEMKFRPSGQYRYKLLNDVPHKHAIMKLQPVTELTKMFTVKLLHNSQQAS